MRTKLKKLLMVAVICILSVASSYATVRLLFAELIGDPPLFEPDTPLHFIRTISINSGNRCDFSISRDSVTYISYNSASHTLTCADIPSNIWFIVKFNDPKIRDVWFWNKGDNVVFEFKEEKEITLTFYWKAKYEGAENPFVY